MHVDFPFHLDAAGRTAATDDSAHIRQMIEQVLFTVPGERVNRPDFGTPLLQMVFTANSPEMAAATQFLVQGALQKFLGDVIAVRDVSIDADDARLRVTVSYSLRTSREDRVAEFSRSVP